MTTTTTQPHDDDLLARARRGREDAWAELFRRHGDPAFRVARRYVRADYDAQDIVQEAFVRAYRKIDSYDSGRGHFAAWLARIVANEAVSWLRRERLRATGDVDELPSLGAAAALTDPAPAPDAGVQYADVVRALERLPAGARTVFNLAVFDGYPHEEIGELLGITASASRAQLTRARTQLRAYLQPLQTTRA